MLSPIYSRSEIFEISTLPIFRSTGGVGNDLDFYEWKDLKLGLP
jgi:hypothetical protein